MMTWKIDLTTTRRTKKKMISKPLLQILASISTLDDQQLKAINAKTLTALYQQYHLQMFQMINLRLQGKKSPINSNNCKSSKKLLNNKLN